MVNCVVAKKERIERWMRIASHGEADAGVPLANAGPVTDLFQAAVKGLGSFSECQRRPQLKQTYCRMINPLCRSVAVSARGVPPHFLHLISFGILSRWYTPSHRNHTGKGPISVHRFPAGYERHRDR